MVAGLRPAASHQKPGKGLMLVLVGPLIPQLPARQTAPWLLGRQPVTRCQASQSPGPLKWCDRGDKGGWGCRARQHHSMHELAIFFAVARARRCNHEA